MLWGMAYLSPLFVYLMLLPSSFLFVFASKNRVFCRVGQALWLVLCGTLFLVLIYGEYEMASGYWFLLGGSCTLLLAQVLVMPLRRTVLQVD